MNKNIVLHNKFKVYRCPRTNAKIFKDLVENQIIEISVELDKDKDMKIFFFLSENHHENKPVYQHK